MQVEDLDPRDGPTKEWLNHHNITHRRGPKSYGKRVWPLAEQLMEKNQITPEEVGYCLRYAKDYERGVSGASRSIMYIGNGGASGGHPSEERLDHHTAYREAAAAVDRALHAPTNPNAYGHRPSEVLRWFAQENVSFREIGRRLSRAGDEAKSLVLRCSVALATHYQALDERDRRSTNPHTKEGVRRALDPEDRPLKVN